MPLLDLARSLQFGRSFRQLATPTPSSAECLKEAWATAKEIAEGDAMRAEWARRRRLFTPERFHPWIAPYIALYQGRRAPRATAHPYRA